MENWKTIPGYAGAYEASDHGRVRSLDRVVPVGEKGTRRIRGCILSPVMVKRYPAVTLRRSGEQRLYRVHMLVALAFLGRPPGPIGRLPHEWQVNHIDGDKANNAIHNLEWMTGQQNGDAFHPHRATPTF